MVGRRLHQYLKPYRISTLRPYFNPLRDMTRAGMQRLPQPFLEKRFTQNLQRLNDALATTPLAERYWLTGGLLLGWARERRVLPWDVWDADFCFLEEHRPEFLKGAAILERAGYRLLHRLRNNAGEVTQYRFVRGGAWFEFFETRRVSSRGIAYLENFVYGKWRGEWHELRCRFPAYGLDRLQFLDRSWLKPDDHDADLTAAYGDWRVPQTHFDFATESASVVQRTLWSPPGQAHVKNGKTGKRIA